MSFTFLLLKPKTSKYLPFSVCSPFLIQFHLSTPSAPRGIDTLIYRKATIDPLDLWVIKNRLLARLPGEASQLNLLTSPPSAARGRRDHAAVYEWRGSCGRFCGSEPCR